MFTGLIQELGVEGVQVEEVYGLEAECLQPLEPILGLIFLFKWEAKSTTVLGRPAPEAPVWFAKQIVHNACATQAILSCLLNIRDGGVELGAALREFSQFTADFDPELRGQAIGASEQLQRVHNSFGRPELRGLDAEVVRRALGEGEDEEGGDPFHFIALLPVQGQLYEFDGLQSAPLCHGPVGETWLSNALAVIQAKVAMAPAHEIRFNLMALIKDRQTLLRQQLEQTNIPALKAELTRQLQEEEERMNEYRRDNALRRHNFVPFLLHMATVLVDRNLL